LGVSEDLATLCRSRVLGVACVCRVKVEVPGVWRLSLPLRVVLVRSAPSALRTALFHASHGLSARGCGQHKASIRPPWTFAAGSATQICSQGGILGRMVSPVDEWLRDGPVRLVFPFRGPRCLRRHGVHGACPSCPTGRRECWSKQHPAHGMRVRL